MTVTIMQGDCRDVLRTLADGSIDACVTDPPYELGFMGKGWDRTGIANDVAVWRQVLRVLKPGGHLLAFGGTRTYHRMVCAVEDAGFEIRDQIGWLYGSGFPKSLDVSKAIDSRKDWAALRTLQSKVRAAREAIDISQSEAARRMGLIAPGESLGGGGFMWFETGMRVPTREQYPALKAALQLDGECDRAFEAAEREVIGQHRATAAGQNMRHGIGGGDDPLPPGRITMAATDAARQWQGWGTALKPAWEPIVMARKPLAGTVAANVLQHGTGALNVDGCRVGDSKSVPSSASKTANKIYGAGMTSMTGGTNRSGFDPNVGRWPANIVHDGSDEVMAAFPWSKDGVAGARTWQGGTVMETRLGAQQAFGGYQGEGSAARFFYTAKASRFDRNDGLHGMPEQALNWSGTFQSPNTNRKSANHHPTVKPTDLMRWLVRLVTPPGGTVLDPFMGSGSTLKAAELEGFNAIGIELDPAYIDIARRRIASDAPLFAEVAA